MGLAWDLANSLHYSANQKTEEGLEGPFFVRFDGFWGNMQPNLKKNWDFRGKI